MATAGRATAPAATEAMEATVPAAMEALVPEVMEVMEVTEATAAASTDQHGKNDILMPSYETAVLLQDEKNK